ASSGILYFQYLLKIMILSRVYPLGHSKPALTFPPLSLLLYNSFFRRRKSLLQENEGSLYTKNSRRQGHDEGCSLSDPGFTMNLPLQGDNQCLHDGKAQSGRSLPCRRAGGEMTEFFEKQF